jgi:hypothetical protein
MQIRVKVTDRDTITYLRKIETSLNKNVFAGVTEASEKLTYYVKGMYLNRKGPNSIDRSSGEIYRSTIPIKTKQTGNSITGGTHIGASPKANKYIHTHISTRPKTTIIMPKKANGYLAIPLGPATSTFGVRRVKPRELPNAQFRGRTLGTAVSGGYVPYFVLTKSVTIHSKVHTKKIANEYKPQITAILDKHILRGLNE